MDGQNKELLDDFDINFGTESDDTDEDLLDFADDMELSDTELESDLDSDLESFEDIEDIEEPNFDESLSDFEDLNEILDDTEESLNDTNELKELSEEIKEDIEQEELEQQEEKNETVTNISNNKSNDIVLYAIIDKYNPSMLDYFRGYGVKISKIFTNIAEIRDAMLIQTNISRLVIIDTGTGRFTNMSSRNALIDLIGVSDSDTRISVFYTDSIIKTEVSISSAVEDKNIEWLKYRSTADLLANLLQKTKTENYIYDSNLENETTESIDNSLDFKGLSVKCEKQIDLGLPTIQPDEIRINMVENQSEEGVLEGYNIKV